MSESPRTWRLAMVPLRNSVLFPSQIMPLSVGRPRSTAAIDAAVNGPDKALAVLSQKDATVDQPALADLNSYGVRAVIRKVTRNDNGLEVAVLGVDRVRVLDLVARDTCTEAIVEAVPVTLEQGPEIEAMGRSLYELMARVLSHGPNPVTPQQLAARVQDPLHLVYLMPSLIQLPLDKQQALLAAPTLGEALKLAVDTLASEEQIQHLQEKIVTQVESELDRERKEFLLRQQMKAIQRELGEDDEEAAETEVLREKLDEARLPEHVRKEAMRELKRLSKLPPAAPDYQVTRTWLDLVAELPWNAEAEHTLDLGEARRILDAEHYGLKDVKERILEHLAVMKLNPEARSPILCLVGPPGVGKTSLGQSIARALGRPFERTSLGGLHDEAELRGHRRTYIGAMPGRLIAAVRRAGVKNPVLMLDEIDKMGRDFRGDPAAALMEILDPAQNREYRDNYLDLPFDLSRTFFILTANTLDGIPRPLLDRMEVLQLSGYSDDEKAEIAERYLLPRQRQETGVGDVALPRETLLSIIRNYTREAGVRQLDRAVGRLLRKVALRQVENGGALNSIGSDDLVELLGPERRLDETLRRQLPAGVAAGLAWTETGGEVLYVEAVALGRGDGLVLTGQLGDIMQESARAARSYVLSRSRELEIPEYRARESAVHVHVPAGATPKDGPSAGVTMATALLSAYTGVPVRNDVAMTGEITLTGLVLPVGGVKEKVLAAHRLGFRQVILPQANMRDLRDLPDSVRDSMTFTPVETLDEVWRAAINVRTPDLSLAS